MSPLARGLAALWTALIPPRFREELRADLEEGWGRARARSRVAAARWLLREIAGTPYLALWRRALWGGGRATAPGGARVTLDRLAGDLWVALRSLRRRPGFAAVAVGTLTLSIGAATLAFSLLEGVLLRPLPYPGADRLQRVYGTNAAWRDGDQDFLRRNWDRASVSPAVLEAWARLGPVDAIGGFQEGSGVLGVAGELERIAGARITTGFFATLGVEPLLGRLPTPEEVRGHAGVVVLGERLWSRRFGRDPGALGSTVTLEGMPYTVVGVMPRTFAVPSDASGWWAPIPSEWGDVSNASILAGIVRLAPGGDPAGISAVLSSEVERLAESDPAYATVGARAVPLRDELLGNVSSGLLLLFGAVGVVVLIACVNLTNLVVARGAGRLPEIAMRTALGAGRASLVGTVLAEVLILCAIGGALGVALAALALDPAVAFVSGAVEGFPRADNVQLNGAVLVFSSCVTVLTALAAGVLPAWAASRRPPWQVLRSGTRGQRSRGARRIQHALLAAEAALTMVLLAGAGLLVRSLAEVFTLDPGFESRGVAYVPAHFPAAEFASPAELRAAVDEAGAALGRVPGARAALPVLSLPALGTTMSPVRSPEQPVEAATLVARNHVAPGYFEALSIPLLRGRAFQAGDDEVGGPVAILSEILAERLFGPDDPIGRFVHVGSGAVMVGGQAQAASEDELRVVGVVGDIRQVALVLEPQPLVYRPLAQVPSRRLFFVVTTGARQEARLLPALRAAVAGTPGVVVGEAGVFREQTLHVLAPLRVRTVLLVGLAGLAGVLAMVGIYGVVSYLVSEQMCEIGIRVALGSRVRGESARMMRQTLLPSALGCGVGLVVAVALSGVLEAAIFEVSRLDPLTYLSALALLLTAAAAAAWLPARRAASVDPVEVLKGD